MKTEIVKYKGVEYKVRTIELRDKVEGQILNSKIRIAPIGLNEAYDDNEMSEYGSKVQRLDASIDHYVTNEVIETVADVVTQSEISEVLLDVMACEEIEW